MTAAGCLAGRGRSGTDGRTRIGEEFSISMALFLTQTWKFDLFQCFLSWEHRDMRKQTSRRRRDGYAIIFAQNTLWLGSLGGVVAGSECIHIQALNQEGNFDSECPH